MSKKHKVQAYVDEYTKKALLATAESTDSSESNTVSRILKNYYQPATTGSSPNPTPPTK